MEYMTVDVIVSVDVDVVVDVESVLSAAASAATASTRLIGAKLCVAVPIVELTPKIDEAVLTPAASTTGQ